MFDVHFRLQKGYRKQDAYIVTQIPLENNREQFWKMIECTGCSSIVLLAETNSSDLIVNSPS